MTAPELHFLSCPNCGEPITLEQSKFFATPVLFVPRHAGCHDPDCEGMPHVCPASLRYYHPDHGKFCSPLAFGVKV